jgi:hypothetical protein
MKFYPFEQGALDYCCGFYALANAVKLIDRKMSNGESVVLFRKALKCLEKKRKRKLSSVAGVGLTTGELNLILREVISNRYDITVQRPFYRIKRPFLNKILKDINDFMTEGPKRAVIAALGGEGNDHWTVVAKITGKEIHFYDSSGIKKLRRGKCTAATASSIKPYSLCKKDIFFLSKQYREDRFMKKKDQYHEQTKADTTQGL